MKLDRLPWIDISPYDQVLTDLISSCQRRDMSLICVQGPNGSGKSRILTELLSSLSFDASASLIALSGHDHKVFYHNVEVSSDLLKFQDSTFLHNFTLTLEAILKDKQHFYILIDDVEVLPYDIVSGIMNILNDNPSFKAQLTLVVFMGAIPIHLETQHLLSGAQIITLTGMTVAQAKQFIDKVYHYTHQQKELTTSEVNHLHGLSYGYAGRLIKLLEQSLESSPKHAKPIQTLWWVLGVFLAMPLLGLFLWHQYDFKDFFFKKEKVLDDQLTVEPILIQKEIVPVKVILPVYAEESKVADLKNTTVLSKKDEISAPAINLMPINIVDKIDKKPQYNYVIELDRHHSRVQLENILKGRSIPGKAQFIQVETQGSKMWVAYIGPYGSKEQAIQGKNKLPASLQSLPLTVRKEF